MSKEATKVKEDTSDGSWGHARKHPDKYKKPTGLNEQFHGPKKFNPMHVTDKEQVVYEDLHQVELFFGQSRDHGEKWLDVLRERHEEFGKAFKKVPEEQQDKIDEVIRYHVRYLGSMAVFIITKLLKRYSEARDDRRHSRLYADAVTKITPYELTAEQIEGLMTALVKYGQHEEKCKGDGACGCGLEPIKRFIDSKLNN
jgi:hypothetical protein